MTKRENSKSKVAGRAEERKAGLSCLGVPTSAGARPVGLDAACARPKRTVADLVPLRAAPQFKFAPDQREQVEQAIAINDAGGSLTAVQVWKLLRDEYGFRGSRETFVRICDREFGRQVRV